MISYLEAWKLDLRAWKGVTPWFNIKIGCCLELPLREQNESKGSDLSDTEGVGEREAKQRSVF